LGRFDIIAGEMLPRKNQIRTGEVMSAKMRVLLTILAIFGICQLVGGQLWAEGGVEGNPYNVP